jgi:hypothetical protein
MELTGKCKEEFETWFLRNSEEERSLLTKESKELIETHVLLSFYIISDAAKYGIYIDFFDSVGIHPGMIIPIRKEFYFLGTIYITRNEARIQAIIKSNEMYNGINR